MADKSEWKTPSMESEGKGNGHQYGQKPRTPEPNPNSWETHLVRKRWDIGLLRALSLRIMMMMISTTNYSCMMSMSLITPTKLLFGKHYLHQWFPNWGSRPLRGSRSVSWGVAGFFEVTEIFEEILIYCKGGRSWRSMLTDSGAAVLFRQ